MDSHDKSAVTAEPALRLFLLLWGTVCGAAALVPLVVRLLERNAVTPWEAQIAMEGIRFNAGLPLYEAGHATHLYGPLLSLMLGIIFKGSGTKSRPGPDGFFHCWNRPGFPARRPCLPHEITDMASDPFLPGLELADELCLLFYATGLFGRASRNRWFARLA